MRKSHFWRISIPALLMTSGCAALLQPRTVTPIPFQAFGDPAAAESLVLLLPGIRDRLSDFHKQGFIGIAQTHLQAQPSTALLAVDAHWGYYRERSINRRLKEDILARFPDKPVTVAGISLGGFGALLMALEQPQRVQRLILLSPFLGEDDYAYLERLQATGPVDRADDAALERSLNRIWRFLLDPERQIPVTLAYGEDDRFAPYYEQLRSMHPPNLAFMAIRGGHDWNSWRSLWRALAPLAIQAGGEAS